MITDAEMKIKSLRKIKEAKVSIEFTDEEKDLIRNYCDIRLKQIVKRIDKTSIIEIKKNMEKSYIIAPILFNDLYDMVINMENAKLGNSSINKSIIAKMNATEYYKKLCKKFEKSQKAYKKRIALRKSMKTVDKI